MVQVHKYAGWEDDVVALIPHENYVKLAQFKGVEFWGNNRFMAVLFQNKLKNLCIGRLTGGQKLRQYMLFVLLRKVLQNFLKCITIIN